MPSDVTAMACEVRSDTQSCDMGPKLHMLSCHLLCQINSLPTPQAQQRIPWYVTDLKPFSELESEKSMV